MLALVACIFLAQVVDTTVAKLDFDLLLYTQSSNWVVCTMILIAFEHEKKAKWNYKNVNPQLKYYCIVVTAVVDTTK